MARLWHRPALSLTDPSLSRRPPTVVYGEAAECKEGHHATRHAKISVPELQRLKASGQKITALTAYDYPFARILDECGIDFLLVGDSLGTTVQGGDTTLPVTMDDMVYHLRLVNRARPRSLVVGDMPFLSYQAGICEAIANSGRLLKEGGAEAVKLEGGVNVARVIKAIVNVDIPVMGHIGLTPQSVHRMGGYKVQGKKSGRQPGARSVSLKTPKLSPMLEPLL